MGCNNINEQLTKESGRIVHDIYRRTFASTPWLHLVDQASWPDQMGDTINQLVYERALPTTTTLTWQSIVSGTDSCLPPKYVIDFGQTLRSFSLSRMAIESDPLCVDKLRTSFDVNNQLGQIIKILADNTAYWWKERYRDEYTRVSQHNVVAAAGLPEAPGSSGMPLVAATSTINQGILDQIYSNLVMDGAQNDNPMGMVDGAPVFGLILSMEASNMLLRGDDNFRQDVRWSAPTELLKSIGATFSRRGYVHMIDPLPPRYNFTGGAWVRVFPYTTQSTTLGNSFEISAAYKNAAFEDLFVFHRMVYKSLVPSFSQFHGTRFNPVTYRGDFTWRNILVPDTGSGFCNPDGTIGFFRGLFYQASQPVFPQYGYVVRYKRCLPEPDQTTCVYST